MKFLSLMILSVALAANTIAFADAVKKPCPCVKCECTPDANCGCMSATEAAPTCAVDADSGADESVAECSEGGCKESNG